jgi:hypothetical protein
MKRLRKLDKEEILYNMFSKEGDKHSIESILEKTGISSISSLKVLMWRLKNPEIHTEDSLIFLSIKNGQVLRLK